MTNFRNDSLTCTLEELMAICFNLMPHINEIHKAQKWIENQLTETPNLLPVRKYSKFSRRGSTLVESDKSFISVDNEPLIALYQSWIDGKIPTDTILSQLERRQIPASWYKDGVESSFKFCGVNAHFRKLGLKLAHIVDAADSSAKNHTTRYLRTMSPLNLFLFPSYRIARVEITKNPENINEFERADLAECRFIQQLAKSILFRKLQKKLDSRFLTEDTKFAELEVSDSIIEKSKNIIVKVNPLAKVHKSEKRSNVAIPSVSNGIKNRKSEALNIDEAVLVLKKWRCQNPSNFRIDGRKKGSSSNGTPWFHFKVDGYQDSLHDYTSKHGCFFYGSEYNGGVHFNGDAKWEAIVRFIELYDICNDNSNNPSNSFRDFLVPSATQQREGYQKQRFALNGYEEEKPQGFYLYHDDATPKPIPSMKLQTDQKRRRL